jgi:hypothetical protein
MPLSVLQIVLSRRDSIVPVQAVLRYLEAKQSEGLRSFEVLLFHGHHGQMMLDREWIGIIGRKVQERTSMHS